MGRLGLGGDKPLRKIAELSGGEKARVALAMFALKASNVLVLDEPSNHLDVESIEALSSALSSWGKKDGAVIVVSHDKAFCESVGFNTVGTVQDGSLVVEERDLNDNDWRQYELQISAGSVANESTSSDDKMTEDEKEELKKRRKLAYNAPKLIAKLEKKIETCEMRIAELDEEMMTVGNDVGKLTDISNKKIKEEEKVAEMIDRKSVV